MKKGDRVKLKDDCLKHMGLSKGSKATVLELDSISMRFDKNFEGHSCGGKCTDGHGWHISLDHFIPIGHDTLLSSTKRPIIRLRTDN